MNNPQSTPPEEVELDIDKILVCNCGGNDILNGKHYDDCAVMLKPKLLSWREAYADKARIEEAENARKYFTKPVIELDQRISALRKVHEGE